MEQNLIFLPVLAQVALTVWAYMALARAKSRALRADIVDLTRRALHDDAWPDDVLKISNNIRNQFQVPVLFYVLCFMLWALEAVGWPALISAWIFVLTRIVHFAVHTGANVVSVRRRVFMIGCLALVVLLVLALLGVVAG